MSEYSIELSMTDNSGIILWNDSILENFAEVWPEGSDRSYIPSSILDLVEEWVGHDHFSLERRHLASSLYVIFGVMVDDYN